MPSPSGCPRPAWSPSTGSSGRATPGSPRPSSRSPARSPSTCPPARLRASSWPHRRPIPRRVATDLITQAEHGPDSPALLVTTDVAFADAVEAEVRRPAGDARRRRDILERSLGHARPDRPRAGPRRRDRLRQRLRAGAPVGRRRAAGAHGRAASATPARVFVGPWAPESAGDYATGANHVLPTGGLARSSGGLSVADYRQVHPGPAHHARRTGRHRPTPSPSWPRPRACSPTAMPSPVDSDLEDADR